MSATLLVLLQTSALPVSHTLSLTSTALFRSSFDESNLVGLPSDQRWGHVGDHVYYAPDGAIGLSQNISNYYYAIGSESALTPELRALRVGGEGRRHIFYLPEGLSLLQAPRSNVDRRSSMSALSMLRDGEMLPKEFPEYIVSSKYKSPLSASGQQIEREAASLITGASVKSYLEKVVKMYTRSYTNPIASHKAVAFLQDEFESLGISTCQHKFKAAGRDLINVVAYVPGTDQESIVVGAHYDSRPFSGVAPGAEDNGSGLAALLAMAKAFQTKKVATKKSVYFVGFGGEEGGLFGSDAFAASLSKHGEGIPKTCKSSNTSTKQMMGAKAAIIMDEIGWLSPSLKKIDGSLRPTVNLESYDWTRSVMDHLAGASKDLNANELFVTHSNNPFGSDHMSFLNRGMMAVLTINGDDESYPCYHQSTDTSEHVTSDYAASIARMNFGALLRMTGLQQ